MQTTPQAISLRKNVSILNIAPHEDPSRGLGEIFAGLSSRPRKISSKYFYDRLGSRLFEELTTLPEYYLARTEKPLIEQAAAHLKDQLSSWEIVELGSGDCSKISLILDKLSGRQLNSLCYRPVDISLSAVEESAIQLADRFPEIEVDALIADFMAKLDLLPPCSRTRLFCIFGSTIGNLDGDESVAFFENLGSSMNPGDLLLLGADMVKDTKVLESAYNDSRGLTARFNLNILNAVNDVARTNFDTRAFEHRAFFNPAMKRIEMHLEAKADQVVTSPHFPHAISIAKGETVHTENSQKFTDRSIERLGALAGLSQERVFTDEANWFSLFLFAKHG